ncbi:MAG: hypothetical protein ACYDH8_00485 [Syntrophales bacterium]
MKTHTKMTGECRKQSGLGTGLLLGLVLLGLGRAQHPSLSG